MLPLDQPRSGPERYRELFEFLASETGAPVSPISLEIGEEVPQWSPNRQNPFADTTSQSVREGTAADLYCSAVNSGQIENLISRTLMHRATSKKLLAVVSGIATGRSIARQIAELDPLITLATLGEIRSPKAAAVLSARADLVITTPELLHRLVIPDSYHFAPLLEQLAEVMLWDLTSFRGILGSHLHHLLRRLEAVLSVNRSSIQYSATATELGHAGEFFDELLGVSPRVIPLAREHPTKIEVVMVDPSSSRWRQAPATIAARIAAKAAGDGFCVLVITQSRLQAELISLYVQERAPESITGAVLSYRGGYLGSTRSEIESEISAGRSSVVVATSALSEDQGDFEVVVVVGFPGMLSRFRREIGRITASQGAAVLVAEEDLLDSWIVANSQDIATRPNEVAAINPWNPEVLRYQLLCASSESCVEPELYARGDPETAKLVREELEYLREEKKVVLTEAGYLYTGSVMPQSQRGLRGDQHRRYLLVTSSGEVLEELDESRIPLSFYLGAVYRHRGGRYLVTSLDERDALVVATEIDEPIHTKALMESTYRLHSPSRLARASRGIQFGVAGISITEAHVGHEVTGDDGITRGVIESRLPIRELDTQAFFFAIDSHIEITTDPATMPGALHALEHASIGILGLVAICDRWDVGGVSAWPAVSLVDELPLDLVNPQGVVAIYDGYQGGAGIAQVAFDARVAIMTATLEALSSCSCASGCPSCIVSPKCGNNNEPLSKAGATAVARWVIAALR